ncbi:MAG TPA: hypothetical protein PKB02_14785 [Anaerohalosphaeraceae bacterium]|nr:hypothetical protein [Anaerohalosphaeraceae bacterium]
MDESHINPKESCYVIVAYSCKGQPLDAEMEGVLSYIVGNKGAFVSGSFAENKRMAHFWFRHRVDAERFCAYVQDNYPKTKTSMELDLDDN